MTFDYRQTPSTKSGYFIHLGREHTYLFEWANFNDAPNHPKGDAPKFPSWAEFLSALAADSLFPALEVDAVFLTYRGDLILNHYRDSFKWGAVRSPLSPETKPLIAELKTRHLVTPDTLVYWGNWARVDGTLAGSVGQLLAAAATMLYHGTSTCRWKAVQRKGALRPVSPAQRVWARDRKHTSTAVFVTTCPHRAQYFADETAKHDRKKTSERGQKTKIQPLILVTQLLPSDKLVNDHDFLAYPLVEEKTPQHSLCLYGQVGIADPLPIERLAPFEHVTVSLK
jgi:hypothetical protein